RARLAGLGRGTRPGHSHRALMKGNSPASGSTDPVSNVVSRSGRFAGGPADEVAAFSQSVHFDCRLAPQDIRGSIAHARMLASAGILTTEERDAIIGGLEQIAAEIREGRFQWRTELEDVHMNIEAELTRRVPAGAKL